METSFLSGSNAIYIAEVYSRYLEDPSSVDPSWIELFEEFHDGAEELGADLIGPSWAKRNNKVVGAADPDAAPPAKGGKGKPGGGMDEKTVRARVIDAIRALMLIRAYRVRGHLMATLDPLSLDATKVHPELGYQFHGFTDEDLDRPIYIDNVLGMESATLRQILEALRATYCGTIGVEFMHIQDPEQKSWIQKRIEAGHNRSDFTKQGKTAILERLTEAEGFEKFLQIKYTGTKRFGLEGGEAVVPALEQILKRGSQLGLEEVNVGMAHRGRLNVLTSVMHKPYRAIFSEFQGNSANPEDVQGSGDVKYHLGTSADREFDGKFVHLSLQANPSHLEAVDPVVLGKVRAKQTQIGDADRTKVMAILIHGDAAFAGQGLVAECFGLSELNGYRTGGTIHVVI
ncbi:MAG: 2-oxoglutarate dehydrogenase E1 subunit family protein, partial [Rhodospirillaceae bacterium]